MILFSGWGDQVLHGECNTSVVRKRPEAPVSMSLLNLLNPSQQSTNSPECPQALCSALRTASHRRGVPTAKVTLLFGRELQYFTTEWDSNPSCVLFEMMLQLFCIHHPNLMLLHVQPGLFPLSATCCVCFQPSQSLLQINTNATCIVFPCKEHRSWRQSIIFLCQPTLSSSFPSLSQQKPFLFTFRCQSRAASAN